MLPSRTASRTAQLDLLLHASTPCSHSLRVSDPNIPSCSARASGTSGLPSSKTEHLRTDPRRVAHAGPVQEASPLPGLADSARLRPARIVRPRLFPVIPDATIRGRVPGLGHHRCLQPSARNYLP